MNRAFRHASVLLTWTLLAMTACTEKPTPEPDPKPEPDPVPPAAEIVLKSSSSISFAKDGGKEQLLFTANRDWTVTADADWLQLSPASGKASDKEAAVTVSCGSNPDSNKRSAKVTVSAGDKTQAVTVTQAEGAPAFVAVTGLKLSSESAVMLPGETLQLTVTFEPENATNKNVQWRSFDPDVATVSQDGLVTAIQKGEAKVRAEDDNHQHMAFCQITVKLLPPTPVDLGLPVKWGSFNLQVDEPQEFHFHYAWGEPGYQKKSFTWDDYKWWSDGAITKYNKKDGKVLVEQEDDAAFYEYGDGWRIPTKSDFEKLLATRTNPDYKWEWTSPGGWKITCLKNGNSIFLPAGGSTSSNTVGGQFAMGFYWSSERVAEDETQAYYLYFDEETVEIRKGKRCYGFELRAVYVK